MSSICKINQYIHKITLYIVENKANMVYNINIITQGRIPLYINVAYVDDKTQLREPECSFKD